MIDDIVKLLSGKNVVIVSMLLITFGLGYMVFTFTDHLLQDNREFIKSMTETNEKLQIIIEMLKKHIDSN